jgi:hypothetical protein
MGNRAQTSPGQQGWVRVHTSVRQPADKAPPTTCFIWALPSCLPFIEISMLHGRFMLQKRPKTLLVNKKYCVVKSPTAPPRLATFPQKSYGPHGYDFTRKARAALGAIAATGGAAGSGSGAAPAFLKRFFCQPLANDNLFCHLYGPFYTSKAAKNFGQ